MSETDDIDHFNGLHGDLANCTDDELADHLAVLVEEIGAAWSDVEESLRGDGDLRPSDATRLAECARRVNVDVAEQMYDRTPEQPAEDVCPECGESGAVRSVRFLGGWSEEQCRHCGRRTDGESGREVERGP